jgi:PadR family transcriptional regulator PadR
MVSNELLKGTLKTIVLKLLEEKGRMYGYEITQEVERLTRGKIQLTWGALYPTLHKLEADRLIMAEEVSIGKRVRKYYSLTASGTRTAREKVQEFLDFVTTMGQILNPRPSLNWG